MIYTDTNSQGEGEYIAKLEMAELAEISNGVVSGLDGDDELHEGHLLGAHQIHGRQVVYVLHFLPTKHALHYISSDLVIAPDLYTSPSLSLLVPPKSCKASSVGFSLCLANCRWTDQVNPVIRVLSPFLFFPHIFHLRRHAFGISLWLCAFVQFYLQFSYIFKKLY